MTLDEFSAITRERIPTPREFVRFAEALGWQILADEDGRGRLKASKGHPLALALARMLGREPYRTNVLAEIQTQWRNQPAPESAEPAKVEAKPEPPDDDALAAIAERAYHDEPPWGQPDGQSPSVIVRAEGFPTMAMPQEFVDWWLRHNEIVRQRRLERKP